MAFMDVLAGAGAAALAAFIAFIAFMAFMAFAMPTGTNKLPSYV